MTFFVWCIVRAKGVGPIIHQPSALHGSDLSWAMVSSLMSCISNMATLVTYVSPPPPPRLEDSSCLSRFADWMYACASPHSNAPDFASRARRPSAAGMPQLLAVPLTFSIVSFLGIIVSSSSQVIFGQPVWSPIDLLDRFLDDDPSDATRFGVRSFSITNSSLPYAQLTVSNRCGSFRPRSSLRRCVKILRSVKAVYT